MVDEQIALAREALADAVRYGDRLVAACEQTAARLSQGEREESLQTVAQMAEGLLWYVQALAAAVPVLSPGSQPPRESDGLVLLSRLEKAMQAGDYVLLADLILYEVKAVAAAWQTLARGVLAA